MKTILCSTGQRPSELISWYGLALILAPLAVMSLFQSSVCLTVNFVFFNPFPNKPWFLCVCSLCHLKTLWKKEKLLVTSNALSHRVFYPFGEISTFFIKPEIRLQTLSFWKSLKFVVWERVNKVCNCGLISVKQTQFVSIISSLKPIDLEKKKMVDQKGKSCH